MLQPALALQPHFDPPLPPFRTSCIESWFEDFEAALELNGIWLQEFMFEVLEYHLPHDLRCRLTYFSWGPRPYDKLRDAVLNFYGVERQPREQTNRTARDHFPSALVPSATQPVETVPLPTTTGYTGDGERPPASSDTSTERFTTPEPTAPASNVPFLPPEPVPPLTATGADPSLVPASPTSLSAEPTTSGSDDSADSIPTTAIHELCLSSESCVAAPTEIGPSATVVQLAHPAAVSAPLPSAVEAFDTADTTSPASALAPYAIGFVDILAPAAHPLVDGQLDHDPSTVSSGSQSLPALLASESCALPDETRKRASPKPCYQLTTQTPSPCNLPSQRASGRRFSRGITKFTKFMQSARCVERPAHRSCHQQTHWCRRFGSHNARQLTMRRSRRWRHQHRQHTSNATALAVPRHRSAFRIPFLGVRKKLPRHSSLCVYSFGRVVRSCLDSYCFRRQLLTLLPTKLVKRGPRPLRGSQCRPPELQ
uniref:Uncharacterized protein n=1 Tax=Rhipicephalus appendiculatus TaxID=34631 RepID=A0A131YVA6_RHIAP